VTDEATFLQAVQADPENLAVRLAYADWLEEHGDPRAEYLRVEAELKREPENKPLQLRFHELRRLIDRDWQARIDRARIENCMFRFEYQCPKRWEALKPTDQATVRFCDTCRKNVYYCRSVVEAGAHVVEDECVAIDSHVPYRRGNLASPPDPRFTIGVLRMDD